METLKLNPNNCVGVLLGSPKIKGAIWVKIHSVDSEKRSVRGSFSL